MRVVLATRHAQATFIPLALLCLEASLLARGWPAADIVIHEFDRQATAEKIAAAIAAAQPDVVGLSCYVWNVTALLDAARLIRQRLPETRLVLGGPEAGPRAGELLTQHPFLDAVVLSEGEVAFAELLHAWQSGTSAAEVRGIAVREHGHVVSTGSAALVSDLATYPSPHLSVPRDYSGRVACVETQRGCVFTCNFCFYNKDYTLRNRRVPLERVKAELQAVLQQEVLEIFLMDPIFNLNVARAKEICRFIAEHNHRRIPIHSEIWGEFVDAELARLMRDAGFRMVEVGLQTTTETALVAAERRLREQRFLDGIAHLRAHAVPFELHLIYGLPGETKETFRRSLDYAIALDPTVLSIFRLMVLPGTDLRRNAAATGLSFDAEPPYHVRAHHSMSEADVEYGHRMLKSANLLQQSRTIRLLAREPGVSFSGIVDAWMEWADDPFSADDGTAMRFVDYACARFAVTADFFRAFAAVEFAGGRKARDARRPAHVRDYTASFLR